MWDVGVPGVEFLEEGHQVVAADGVAGPDAQLPPVQGVGLQQLILPPADQVHGRLNVLEQDFPLRGQLDLLGAADEQGLVQLLLQHLDGLAHGGLRDEELLGSLREAQGNRHMVKYLV